MKNNINSFIDEKIEQINQIVEGMKGDEYNIEINWKKPDFSLIQKEQLLSITKSFNNFTSIQREIEQIKFTNATLEYMEKNFKIIIENFIPSFGKDYFERIIKYNEIQKIKSLYNNLKYSFTQTINYYIKLCSQNPSITLPEDLKNKILVLNNIDSLINSLNNEEILQLNKKLNNIIEETKDYLVDKYIYYIKVDSTIELSFDKEKKKIIYDLLDDSIEIFENEYYNLINNYIIKQFKEQFINLLNEESNNMLACIEEKKNLLNITIAPLNIIKIDYVLSDIENVLNNITNAINDYNTHFHSFKISEEIPQLLNNYCKDKILPFYDEIKFILDYSTKDIVILNLDKNVKNFKNSYIINNFESTSKSISNNLYSYFNRMDNYLKYSYGAIDTIYLKNLDMEMENYQSIRRLDEIKNIKQKIADKKLDETFNLIKNSSFSIIEFITNLNQFSNFEEKIKKYINKINEQYTFSINNIKNMKYTDINNQKLYDTLDELKKYSINYFTKANSSYYQTKKYIDTSINQINELIEQCANITYEQINNKYINIKNNFHPINQTIKEEKLIEIDIHNENINGMDYIIETKIDKYLIENEITLDIQSEEGDISKYKLVGKIINKSRPHKMIIDFYLNFGQKCEIKGRRMTINFNNINFSSNLIFDSTLNNITIYNNIDFDEYNIKNEKYIIKEFNFIKVLGGITFVFPNLCISTIDGENEIKIVNSKKNSTTQLFEY